MPLVLVTFAAFFLPAEVVLDAHLANWEQATAKATSYSGKFELIRTAFPLHRQHKYSGTLLLMKPKLFRICIQNMKDREDFEAYIFDGKSLYNYDWKSKTVTELPVGVELFPGFKMKLLEQTPVLDLFLNLKTSEVKKRYHIKQFHGDFPNDVYLDIKPTLAKDKQEFEQLRIALHGPHVKEPLIPYMPAALWLLKPNGDTEHWRFHDQEVNVKLDGKVLGTQHFQYEVPKGEGWKIRKMPTNPNLPKQ